MVRAVIFAAGLGAGCNPAAAQARLPLPIASDSTGVLSAIRAIDLAQLCACPVVRLDSIVHRGPEARMYDVTLQPRAFALTADDAARLALARRRVVLGSLRYVTDAAVKDTVVMAVQLLPARAERRMMVVAMPPTGVATAYLVTLGEHRGAWRVRDLRTIYDP